MKNIIAIVALLVATCITTSAQSGISPLIQVLKTNRHGQARGHFSVLNGSLTPTVATVEVRGFAIDENGQLSIQPVDSSSHIALSASSVRVPPQSQSTVDFSAQCPNSCEFSILTMSAPEKKVSLGLSIKTAFAETVYCQSQTINKTDIKTTWQDPLTLLVENLGEGFDRPEVDARLDGKMAAQPSIPLMPHVKRFVHFPSKPSKITLQFERFKVETNP
jgi:hypothetical protein